MGLTLLNKGYIQLWNCDSKSLSVTGIIPYELHYNNIKLHSLKALKGRPGVNCAFGLFQLLWRINVRSLNSFSSFDNVASCFYVIMCEECTWGVS